MLTKKHLGLIEWQLSTFKNIDPRFHDDLRSAGNLGLLNGLRTWDPDSTANFETYCTKCIRTAMLREIQRINTKKVQQHVLGGEMLNPEQMLVEGENPETLVLKDEAWKEGWNRLMDILPELSYRQEFILMHRIYCEEEDELTQAEIASRFRCNQSTIQREEKRLYAYLKDAG